MSNTAKQEDCSILFFKEHCDKKFKLSDKQYAELDKKAFGKGGVYPQANAIWRRSYDEQVDWSDELHDIERYSNDRLVMVKRSIEWYDELLE